MAKKQITITAEKLELLKANFPELHKLALRFFEFVVKPADPAPDVPVETPPVTTSLTWEQRLARPMLFFSGPNYFWHNVPAGDVPKICDAILAAGLTGPSIEFGGDFIADEYNGRKTDRSVVDIYMNRIGAWAVWEQALRVRGLVAHIAFLNSNQSAANKASDQAWTHLAQEFVARHGTRNKIVLALSEDDGRTRASIRGAITKGLGFPAAQLITHDGKGGTIREEHHSRQKIVTGKGHRFLNVTDNGPAIADLYGSKWTSGGTPNVANIEDFAARIRAGGVSGAVYSFSTAFDFAGLAAASKGWKSEGAEVPSVGILRGAKFTNFPKVQVDAPAIEDWPTKTVDGAVCCAQLFLDGKKVEWIKRGNKGLSSVWNALNKKDPRYYRPGFAAQKTCAISVADVNGKNESNRIVLEKPVS